MHTNRNNTQTKHKQNINKQIMQHHTIHHEHTHIRTLSAKPANTTTQRATQTQCIQYRTIYHKQNTQTHFKTHAHTHTDTQAQTQKTKTRHTTSHNESQTNTTHATSHNESQTRYTITSKSTRTHNTHNNANTI